MSIERAGPTPAGGTRSVAHLYGKDGREVDDPADAVRGEIIELDEDDLLLKRTYFGQMEDPGLPVPAGQQWDSPLQDEIKVSWDVYVSQDGIVTLVDTLDKLLIAQDLKGQPLRVQRDRIGHILGLSVWEHAPAELKTEVYAWLESTRQE